MAESTTSPSSAAVLRYPNLANRPSVQRKVINDLLPMAQVVREERRSILHPDWLRYDRIWKMQRDSAQGYHGRVQTYLPIGRRVLENWVQKLKQDLFPQSGRWFAIHTDVLSQESQVPSLHALFTKYLMQWMNLRGQLGPYLRSLVTFGTTPVEIGWKTIEKTLPVLQPTLDDQGQPTAETEVRMKEVLQYLGPTWRQVDLFLWYCWPNTANNPRDYTLTIEDMLLSQREIERLGRTPISADDEDLGTQFQNVRELLNRVPRPESAAEISSSGQDNFQEEQQRLAAIGLRSPSEAVRTNPRRDLDVTKFHWLAAFDDEPQDVWYEIVVGMNAVPLRVRRVPWFHQEHPYLVGKFVELHNEAYGHGLPEVFDSLQYFLTDVMNQTGDAMVWSMNPIAAVDPFEVQEPSSIRMRPGAKWLVRKPRENVLFTEPTKETAGIGFTAVQQLIALINDVSNVAPFGGAGLSSGTRQRGRALQTATGMQIVASEALVQVRDVVENQEDQVFNPMLQWFQVLSQQCLDRGIVLAVEGRKAAALVQRRVTAADCMGEFTYRWLGSTHAFNMQVRSQQMLTFLQILARIPAEILQQQNATVDWKYLLRQIWAEGFALPDAERIIREATPMRAIDPLIENDLFRAGHAQDVVVSPADDDLDHARKHDGVLQDPNVPDVFKQDAIAHIRRHMAAFITKNLLSQMEQQGQLPQLGGQGNGNGAGGVSSLQQPSRSGSPIFPGTTARGMSTGGFDDTVRGTSRGVQ